MAVADFTARPNGVIDRTLMWVGDRFTALRSNTVAAWLLPAGIFLTVLFIGVLDRPLYERLIHEDGPIEWAQMLLALVASVVAAVVCYQLRRHRAPTWLVACWGLGAVGMFVLAGEEVSWGQRQVGFAGPDTLTALNQQNEANVHNLLAPWALSATYTVVGVLGAGVAYAVLRRLARIGRFAGLLAPSWRSVAAPWFGVHAVVYAWYSVVEPIARAVGVDVAMDDHLRKLGEGAELVLAVGFAVFTIESLVVARSLHDDCEPPLDARVIGSTEQPRY